MKPSDPNKSGGRVIDLSKEKYKRLVLDTWDRLEREDQRKKAEQRAEIERAARNKI